MIPGADAVILNAKLLFGRIGASILGPRGNGGSLGAIWGAMGTAERTSWVWSPVSIDLGRISALYSESYFCVGLTLSVVLYISVPRNVRKDFLI